MPIQTSLGQIRTMAEDLSKVSKAIPSPSTTPPEPKPMPKERGPLTPPPINKSERPEPLKTTSPPPYTPQVIKPKEVKKLEELLPLTEAGTETKKPSPTNLDLDKSKQENQNRKPISEGDTMADLEDEIFPKPVSQEQKPQAPEQKAPPSGLPTEFSAPTSSPRKEEASPSEETPEQILGTEKLPSPVAPPFSSMSEQEEVSPEPVEPQTSLPSTPPQTGESFGSPPASIPLAPEGGFAQPPKKFTKNIVLIVGALVVLGAVLAGGVAFLFFSGIGETPEEPPQQEEPAPEEPPETTPISPPTAIMTPDFVQELSVKDTLESTLRGVIKDIAENQYPQNSITYLPIRVSTTEADTQFLTAQAFITGLNITLPEEFFGIVRPVFMLYLYGSGDAERITCQNNLVSEKSCYGPGLGLVFEAQEGKESELATLMEQWVSLVSPQSNLDAFVSTDLAEIPEEIIFDSVDYKSEILINSPAVMIRYINLPMPSYDGMALSSTALDFAVIGNKIVFSTSKKSMETAIDRLLQE